MQNLLDELTELLKDREKYTLDGVLMKNAVIEATLKMDSCFLELLLSSETIKEYFFTEVSGVLVFDKVQFQKFVSNKAFLPDNYTAFKKRIGLENGGGYINHMILC